LEGIQYHYRKGDIIGGGRKKGLGKVGAPIGGGGLGILNEEKKRKGKRMGKNPFMNGTRDLLTMAYVAGACYQGSGFGRGGGLSVKKGGEEEPL